MAARRKKSPVTPTPAEQPPVTAVAPEPTPQAIEPAAAVEPAAAEEQRQSATAAEGAPRRHWAAGPVPAEDHQSWCEEGQSADDAFPLQQTEPVGDPL